MRQDIRPAFFAWGGYKNMPKFSLFSHIEIPIIATSYESAQTVAEALIEQLNMRIPKEMQCNDWEVEEDD